ncbi:helix-turn-helix domain-containing protein [Agromyces bracchium]|uniref:PucR C-terminal helix-turn-helix domain-containing protein n=1 Tax=Agromyces bracchium TaxID=88376 RepID=A0A6I3M8M5_9MICO|nr:helix-turn-helix domain-containing protein [Agromyces bracchium]MTH66933.1 hypothetical protein [Agromyces bracchium]
MQELVGRLTALDPEAIETLKVISYFDTLLAGSVGVETLIRGAAVLSGAVAGHAVGDRLLRIAPDGERLPPSESADAASAWPSRPTGDGAFVWLERTGPAHANDAMVLERLALAVSVTTARRAPAGTGAVELAVSAAASADERGTAAARLRLDGRTVRAVALPPSAEPIPPGPTALIATARGLARAVLDADGVDVPEGVRAGIGTAGPPERLPESWTAALIALRLTSPLRPVVDARDLGGLLLVAEAADRSAEPHPDAIALERLDDRARAVLAAFEATGSLRAVAARLGMHHSTVQAKLDGLAVALGYDPREPEGRTRLALAETLAALARPGLGAE